MKKLSIPEKITLQYEFFPGFGKRELLHFLILALPGLLIGIVLHSILTGVARFWVYIGMVIYLILCYPFVARIDGYPSVVSVLLRIWKYLFGQRNYYFKQKKERIYEIHE